MSETVKHHRRKLIRKLTALSEEFPELCQLDKVEENCGYFLIVDKKRISIHVTRPYSEERQRKQSEWAKEHGMKGNRYQS